MSWKDYKKQMEEVWKKQEEEKRKAKTEKKQTSSNKTTNNTSIQKESILNTNKNTLISNTNTLQDIINKNKNPLVKTNSNPLSKMIEEKNANSSLQKAIKEQQSKPKTTQSEPSTWDRIMQNLGLGGKGGVYGVAQTGYRDIRDIDNAYTEASSMMRHNVLSTFFGEQGENFARGIDEKLYNWNNDRNKFYNYALGVLNQEQQKNSQAIQQNVEAVKKTGDKVGSKFVELTPSIGQNAMGMMATAVNPALGFTYYKMSSEASYYDDALNRGMTEDQAKAYSKIMSYVEAGTETLSASNVIKGGKVLKATVTGAKTAGVKVGLKAGFNVLKEGAKEEVTSSFKNALKSYGIGIVEEAFQEGITEPLQELTAMATAGKDKADWSNMPQRIFNSAFDGALSSLVLAGANMGISSCQGVVTNLKEGKPVSEEQFKTSLQDASKELDAGKILTDTFTQEVDKLKTELQTQDNNSTNQEVKTSQNETSQVQNDAKMQTINNLAKVKQYYDENTYNQMREFIETAPSEEALNQINEDIKTETKNKLEETYKSEKFTESQDRKRTYSQYKRQNDTTGIQYDNEIVNNALDAVAPNRNGRRTVGQWKQVAEQIGLDSASSGLNKSQIDNIAYGSWFELQPSKNITQYDNRTKQHKGFEKFTSDEWINTIYESAKGQKLQQLDTKLNKNIQYSVEQENTPVQNTIIEESDNLISSAEKYNLNFKDLSIENSQKALDKRGIKARFDESYFNSADEGGKYILTTDDNGKVISREIILNPNANEDTIIQEMAIHELSHDIFASNTQESEDLYKTMKNYLEKDTDFEKHKAQLAESYLQIRDQNGNQVYSRDQKGFNQMVEEEAIAKTLQKKFGTQEEINRLVNTNKNIAQRFYDWIVDKIDTFKNRNNKEYLFWKEVRNKFEKAFAQEGNYENTKNIEKYYFNKVANFDEMEYNSIENKRISSSKTWKSLKDTIDSAIKNKEIYPGVNEIELYDYGDKKYKKYTIYYKDITNWKIVDEEISNDYYGGNHESNEFAENTNERDGRARSREDNNKWNNEQIKDSRETTDDARLFNRNQRNSNTNRDNNIEINRNKKQVELENSSSFSLQDIKNKYKEQTDYLNLNEKDNIISIDNMVVKKELRNKGIGQNILNDIIDYANKTNKTITLTPTSEFNTKNKLKNWYKANGFVENKGKNTNFLISDTMYKNPTSNKNIKYSLNTENSKKSSFSLPENVKEIKNMNEFLRNAIENETNQYWKNRLKEAQSSNYNRITKNSSPLQYKREVVQQYLDFKTPAKDNNGRTLTPQQKEYFKDSVVRNDKGELLEVYHGTSNPGFTEFKRNFNYFTSNQKVAETYTGNNGIYKGYIDIQKPIRIDANGEVWSKIDINNIRIDNIENIKEFLDNNGASTWKEQGKIRTSTADIVSAIADAIDEGKIDADGIIIENIYDEGSYGSSVGKQLGTDYVTFNSNQFKNTDNKTPTINKDIRYSVSTDGAMKDNKTGKKVVLNAESNNNGKNLLAIHNLTEDKLKGVLELGGFPVPSIAITNPDVEGHTQFGNISVIFNKNTINPENRANEVYDRDVWSPTFPRVNYDIDNSSIKNYVTKNLQYDYKDDIISSAITNYMYDSNLLDKIDRNGLEGTLKDLKQSNELKYFYKNVVEKGDYSPKTKPLQYNTNYSNETLQRFIDLFNEDMDLSDFYYHYMNYQDMQMSDKQKQNIKENIKKAIEPEIENEIEEDLKKYPNLNKEEQKKYRKELYEIETNWIENRPYEFREFVANASQYFKNGDRQVVDREATLNDISNHINQEDFEKWIDESFGEMFKNAKKGIRNNKEPYTPSGNLRSFNQLHDEYNLQNVVNALIKKDTKGGEGGILSGGFGEIQAKRGNKFSSIEDIKNAESRLVSSEKAQKELEPLKEKIYDDISDLSNYYNTSGYSSGSYNLSADAISEFAGKKNLTKENFKKILESYYNFEVDKIPTKLYDKIIKDLNSLKNISTDYFEAKPQRAVGFDEIDAIVLPKNASKELKQQLKDRGIKTIEYDSNNENGRADILKSLNEYKFSKTNESFDEYLTRRIGKEGTRTSLKDLKLPMKEKQQVKVPIKQEIQQEQNNNTKGETINWTEIERPENNQKFRKHYRSIIESSNTTAEAKAIAKELMGTDTYTPETNKGQLAQADQRIMTSSPETELQSLLSRAMNGEKINSVDIAVGERLIQYFSKTGDAINLQNAIQATAMAGTSTGQTLQALSILNHQTPQGQVTWIQRSVDKMNKELARKKGGTITTDAEGNLQVINKQGKDITDKVNLFKLTPEMMNKIMQSENQEQMFKNIDEVYEELGQQVPKSMIEKIDSWRYFSMLANARTHIRNMVGNVAMGKMQRVKDKIAGGIEDIASKFNPEMERTKTLRRADAKTKEFAKNDFKNIDVQSRLELNENKYTSQSRLQNARRVFKSDAMENTLGKLFDLNDKLLSAEDGIGLKAGYQKALTDYITANKIDVDNITDAQLNKARNYAVQQAKEATFHQANALASLVNQLGTKHKVGKFIVDATLPFKKTPMNIAKSGIEYSPVGLLKSAIFDSAKLRKGEISVNQYIDNVSKGLTGTGIALVGYALANAGILKASGGDDKDKENYDEEQGKQNYSIKIAGKTYSLDWLAPTGIPLFVGAEFYNLKNQEKNEKSTEKTSDESKLDEIKKSLANIANAGATAMNPMSEMSMISGLTSVLSSYNKDNALGDMVTNMGKSYINQFVPTAMGQLAKTTDKYERTTKSTAKGTLGKALDQTANQIKAKIPGLRQTLPIKTDIWGKEQKQEVSLPLRALNNFVNPATVKTVSTDPVDKELNKLYEVNKNSSLLPDILNKTIQLNKQTYRLSNKEYAEYTKEYGQTSHKLIENLISSSEYRNLTQEQKETAISDVYTYAKEKNKLNYANKVNEKVKPSTLYNTMEEIKTSQGKSEYLNYLAKTKGMSKESEKNKVLANSNYSNKTKEIIYANGTGKDDDLYNDLLSKSNINMTEYLNYRNKVSEKAFLADKNKNGKTITGSGKNKTITYLNNNITGAGNRLLIAGKSYVLQNSEKQKLAEYINQIATTKEEKIEIYKQLDKNFVVKDGKVYIKVSKY